jgi:hypothetical protein
VNPGFLFKGGRVPDYFWQKVSIVPCNIKILSGEKRRPPQKKSSFTLDLPLLSMDSISNSTLHRRQNLTVYLTSKDADFVDHGLKFIQNSNQTKTCEKHFTSMQESV